MFKGVPKLTHVQLFFNYLKTLCLEVSRDMYITTIQRQISHKMMQLHRKCQVEDEQDRLKNVHKTQIAFIMNVVKSFFGMFESFVFDTIEHYHNNLGNNELYLTYNGKIMAPYNTLEDCFSPYIFRCTTTTGSCGSMDNKPMSPITIHANYRLKGGCFIVSFSILMTIIAAVCMSICTCGFSLLVIPILAPLLFILPLFCL